MPDSALAFHKVLNNSNSCPDKYIYTILGKLYKHSSMICRYIWTFLWTVPQYIKKCIQSLKYLIKMASFYKHHFEINWVILPV